MTSGCLFTLGQVFREARIGSFYLSLGNRKWAAAAMPLQLVRDDSSGEADAQPKLLLPLQQVPLFITVPPIWLAS